MWLLLFTLIGSTAAQYTSQTYPDPRLDPITCRLPFPAQICDPSSVLTDEERMKLMTRLNEFRPITAGIRNTSPACQNQPEKNLEIFVIVIDKIGSIPGAPVDIEKFANNLKRRFQNYQDVTACDTTVLIVNSRQDRQVFTVAGRDARISKETLRSAFERNLGHFKAGHYAMGLEGMIELVVATYSNSHIVQVPSPEAFTIRTVVPTPAPEPVMKPVPAPEFRPAPEAVAPFRAAGIPNTIQPSPKVLQPIAVEDVVEDDRVWVGIMQQAVARCGTQPELLAGNVRAVVEEAMSISLKLISDARYNSIEEEVESHKDVIGIRERAWENAKLQFIQPLFQKYQSIILSSAQRSCPAITLKSLRRH
ncbi:hypothetical protein ANCCEY_05145 [Ancylostoma ceylanicum]|uniref:Uncharacterized protein n=1 Tax=Ancylostoma ceylanicum TaxID=53326 RepID=A0A0D6M7E9_9BILA|nr:hypothetical protein ANCCEY_05145 [Ancylostoma ceylanicum]